MFGDQSAAYDPSRAMRSWIASANEISFPLNQRPTTVVAATMKHSEPTPRTNRPASMPYAGARGTSTGPSAMSTLPAAPIAPNSTADRAVPSRSMSTPPAMSVRSAATL